MQLVVPRPRLHRHLGHRAWGIDDFGIFNTSLLILRWTVRSWSILWLSSCQRYHRIRKYISTCYTPPSLNGIRSPTASYGLHISVGGSRIIVITPIMPLWNVMRFMFLRRAQTSIFRKSTPTGPWTIAISSTKAHCSLFTCWCVNSSLHSLPISVSFPSHILCFF